MKFRIFFLFLCLAAVCLASGDAVAERLARQAKKAEKAGQIVRAYLLYAQAAARDPGNSTYRENRDALAPAAKLLTKADVQNADISQDVQEAEQQGPTNPDPPVERATEAEWMADPRLQGVPTVHADASKADFKLRAPAKDVIEQVCTAFGVRAVVDSEVTSDKPIQFDLTQADLRTALEALTDATGTFVFPVSASSVYFAPDTQAKRDALEPTILLTFPLPNALSEKDLIEAANVVRSLLQLKSIGWDSHSRTVMIRDHVTRARIARSVLQALLLPRAQVQIELKFLTVDTDKMLNYGSIIQTSLPVYYLGHIGGFSYTQASLSNLASLAIIGGGGSIFGLGLMDATLLAQYTSSFAQAFFDSTVVVGDRQTASLHFGNKYPLAETLYTGFAQGAPSIYNPTPQITLVDLGLVLKVTPYVNGDGDIGLDVEAELNSLGNQTFNTIPAINDRSFKGTVNMREGQVAIIAGMDSDLTSVTRNGLAGLTQIPGLNQVLAQNTREHQTSQTLILVKPTITRLPMASYISPQYLLGPQRGARVLL
ncbi:MAG: hypothetical protein JOY54_01775 [Acidobacteriaceae bacterium]|nr:hypothetical protein [Acidobacteriaceae bacterium]